MHRLLTSLLLFVAGTVLFAQSPPNPPARTQVSFAKPSGMKIYWLTKKDGKTAFSTVPLETPGRFNFAQGATYQLKLTHIPGRAGVELYPTLEVVRPSAKSAEYLTHNNVPIQLTEDDFKQVVDSNSYIVKAVYLPHPAFQDGVGTDEIASTRLEPGQDPIREATRRGEVLVVLRMGNIRKE